MIKLVHLLSAVLAVLAVVLLFAGAGGAAAVLFGVGVLIELVGSAINGKQSNDGLR